MIYIWRKHEFGRRFKSRITMHISIEAYGSILVPLFSAVCGVPMTFNRFAYGPDHGYPYPVCKNCLRSCMDERMAA